MLRSLAFAFLGLFLIAGPVEARGDGRAGGRRAAEAKAVGAKPESRALLRRVAFSRPAASGPAHCARTGRRAALRCRGSAQAVNWRWAHGLPPAMGVQAQECPAGTMATLAEGHEDIVRCIPI